MSEMLPPNKRPARKMPPVPEFQQQKDDNEQKLNELSKFLAEINNEPGKEEQEQPQPKTEMKSTIKEMPKELNFDKISSMFKQLNNKDKNLILNNPQPQPVTPQQSKKNIPKQQKVPEEFKPKIVSYGNQKRAQISIDEEYDPVKPNDLEQLIQERRLREMEQQQIERMMEIELAQNKDQKKQQKIEKYQVNQINVNQQQIMDIEVQSLYSNKQSSEEKVLQMMQKTGWNLGSGLGKKEQGMTTPLIAKKTNANTAVIVNSEIDMTKFINEDQMKKSRILLLLNMATTEEADEELQEEVAIECSKFGVVINCFIFIMPKQTQDQSVRIFVEFEKIEYAQTALNHLNGRIFAGKTVHAKFYNENSFKNKIYTE